MGPHDVDFSAMPAAVKWVLVIVALLVLAVLYASS